MNMGVAVNRSYGTVPRKANVQSIGMIIFPSYIAAWQHIRSLRYEKVCVISIDGTSKELLQNTNLGQDAVCLDPLDYDHPAEYREHSMSSRRAQGSYLCPLDAGQ